jgi:hypothetical protein
VLTLRLGLSLAQTFDLDPSYPWPTNVAP